MLITSSDTKITEAAIFSVTPITDKVFKSIKKRRKEKVFPSPKSSGQESTCQGNSENLS